MRAERTGSSSFHRCSTDCCSPDCRAGRRRCRQRVATPVVAASVDASLRATSGNGLYEWQQRRRDGQRQSVEGHSDVAAQETCSREHQCISHTLPAHTIDCSRISPVAELHAAMLRGKRRSKRFRPVRKCRRVISGDSRARFSSAAPRLTSSHCFSTRSHRAHTFARVWPALSDGGRGETDAGHRLSAIDFVWPSCCCSRRAATLYACAFDHSCSRTSLRSIL